MSDVTPEPDDLPPTGTPPAPEVEGDPDQVYVEQYAHGEAPAATAPKPPADS